MNIITLGPEGTFSYYLTKEKFPNAHIDCVNSIDAIFENIEKYDKAVVPLENDVSGFVEQTTSHLMTCPFHTEMLLELPIQYNLVGFGAIEGIHTLFTFPHTYKQCYKTLQNLLPPCEIIYTSSNGMSRKKLFDAKTEGYAAIVPRYPNLPTSFPILQEEVQDCSTNTTRFLILSKKEEKQTQRFACFLFSRKTLKLLKSELGTQNIPVEKIKQVPMEGIHCNCYFAIVKTEPSNIIGIDIKQLGFLHGNTQ